MREDFLKRLKEASPLKIGILLITYFILLWNFSDVCTVIGKVGVVLTPFAVGFVFAYIINPIITTIRKLFFKVTKKKLYYEIAMILAYLFVFAIIAVVFISLLPQVWVSINSIVEEMPSVFNDCYNWVTTDGLNNIQRFTNNTIEVNDIVKWLKDNFTILSNNVSLGVSKVADLAIDTTKFLFNCILGVIISIYMLMHKDRYKGQAKKIVYAMFVKEKADRFINFVNSVNSTFSKFISAKVLDSAIIGVLCYIGCLILRFDNALLIGFIVGITNVIPYFGPFIGAIPSALIVLMQGSKEMWVFCIFILILQQFDGNILGPKLLGDSMGLTSLWIIFAVVIMTALFGIVGMVIGVPLFTVIYMLIRDFIYQKLEKKGLSTETEDYISSDVLRK